MKNKLMTAAITIAMLAGTAAIAAAQDYRYYDRDDYYYNHDGDYGRYSFREGMRVARDIGFRDGAQVAREDAWRGKPFNPNPRGPYDDADHGYQRAFGDKREYREHYAEAYRRGYESTFRRDGYYSNDYRR